jgi:hypothetical protein
MWTHNVVKDDMFFTEGGNTPEKLLEEMSLQKKIGHYNQSINKYIILMNTHKNVRN